MSALSGFTPLKDVESARKGSCLLGVIVAIKEPYVVHVDGASQWRLEFSIQDQFALPIESQPRVACRLQRALAQLPSGGGLGDIALLRSMEITMDERNMPLAVNAAETGVLFFPESRIPTPMYSTPYLDGTKILSFDGKMNRIPPSVAEQSAVISMKAAAKDFLPLIQKDAPVPAVPYSNKKFRLVKDMEVDTFCDLVAEVVKTYYTHDAMDLYVTDYTENKDLFLYTDPNDPDNFGASTARNWCGPYGQITIMLHLWDPHAAYVRNNIKEGDVVFLQNVRPRLSPDGKLEGAIVQDRRWPDKICVHKCKNQAQLTDLQLRKDAYEKGFMHKKTCNDQNLPKKASAKSAAKRKEEKKEKQREQQRLEREREQRRIEMEEAERNTRAGLNINVRAGSPDIDRISTVSEIVHNPARKTKSEDGLAVTLPFVNCKYKAHVRVVDMWPSTLADFSQSRGDSKFNPRADPEGRSLSKNRFEWNFALLVEDAKMPARSAQDRIMLTFGNAQGQNLLKMDACDLKEDLGKFKKLEEKLFLLWGNLHERKVALWKEDRIKLPLPSDDPRLKLQSKPFECCIEEYGEPVGQWAEATEWIQRFSTFNTVIMA